MLRIDDATLPLINRECIFFEREGVKATGTVTCSLEAANGVTPAIQGLKICLGVITPRILGGGI